MVFRQVRKISGREYHYIEHSVRIGKKVKKVYFYVPVKSKTDLALFYKTNNKAIKRIADEKNNYIKKRQRFSKFFLYGDVIRDIEKFKLIYNIFMKRYSKKEQEKIMQIFLRKFLVSSMKMEGGTVSYKVAEEIDKKRKKHFKGVNDYDVDLYLQLKKAYVKLEDMEIKNPKQIKDLHKIIYDGIYPFAGNFRNIEVSFGDGTQMALTSKSENIREGLKKAIESYKKNRGKIYEFTRILDFHLKYQQVHAFQDGNSRLGRLIMITQLLKARYPPLLIRGTQSSAYRKVLVQAINSRYDVKYTKFFYQNYKRTFERFWKPFFQEKVKP